MLLSTFVYSDLLDKYIECEECWNIEYCSSYKNQEIGSGVNWAHGSPFASPEWI